MPPSPAITGYAAAEATVGPVAEPTDYGPAMADHEVHARRALQHARHRRLYPAGNAATLACSRLGPVPAGRRTGLVVATSSADRQASGRIRDAFLVAGDSRRLDVVLAASRFVSAGLVQDIAATVGARGPELALPGDCGLAPLAAAGLLIDVGRADVVVVVAVDPCPSDPASYEAVAVVVECAPGALAALPVPRAAAMTTGTVGCVPAVREYLSREPAAPDARPAPPRAACAVRWAAHTAVEPAVTDPGGWLDSGRQLLDQCLHVAGTTELGVLTASFADLSPDLALQAMRGSAAPDDFARQARVASFESGLRHHARRRGVSGPYAAVTGIPGASLLALAIAEDLIATTRVPAVAVLAADWVGAGIGQALAALHCPEGPHLRSSVSAVVLTRAPGRRIRTLVARRDACDEFDAAFRAHAPSVALASGCTAEDLATAGRFVVAQSAAPAGRRPGRFLGADAAACLASLMDQPGPAALSVRNDLGGSGLVLLDGLEYRQGPADRAAWL